MRTRGGAGGAGCVETLALVVLSAVELGDEEVVAALTEAAVGVVEEDVPPA